MSSPPLTPEVVAAVQQCNDSAAFAFTVCVCFGLLIGDWTSHFSKETAFLRQFKKPLTFAYLSARLGCLFSIIFCLVLITSGGRANSVCGVSVRISTVCQLIGFAGVHGILLIRTLAIWWRKTWLKRALCAFWVACVLAWIPLLYMQGAKQNPLGGIDCVAVEPLGKRVRTLAYWIGLAFDSTITVLTILGAKRSGVRPVHLLPRRRSNSSSSFKSASHQAFLRQTRLPRRIVLDQLLYYAVVLGTGLAAVITGVLPDNNVGPFTKILFVPLQLTLASISTCRIVLNLRELMADRRPPANPPAVPFARSLPFSPSPLSPPTAISPSPLSRAHIPIHLESESLWLSTRPRQTSSLDSRPHSHSHSHQPQPQSQLSPSLADATQPTTQPLPLPCSSTTGRHHLDFNFDSDVDVPATASCPNTRNRTHNRTGTCTHTQTRASDHQRPFSSWSGSGTSNGSSGSVSGSGSVGVGVGVGVPQDGGPSPSPTKTRTGKPEPAADEESVYTNPDERKDEHGRRHEHEHEQDLGSDGHAHAHAHGNGNGISGVKMIKETCVQISGPGP